MAGVRRRGRLVVGVAAGESCPDRPVENTLVNLSGSLGSSLCLGHAETGLLAGLVTIPLGALLGAAIAPGERWQPVDDRDLMLTLGPEPGGGVSARVSVRF